MSLDLSRNARTIGKTEDERRDPDYWTIYNADNAPRDVVSQDVRDEWALVGRKLIAISESRFDYSPDTLEAIGDLGDTVQELKADMTSLAEAIDG